MFLRSLLAAAAISFVATLNAQSPSPQQARTFETQMPVRLDYLLSLPDGYEDGEKQHPLLIFLHGAGERGDDLKLVKKHGPPKLIDAGQAFPMIVVSPQCPANERWQVKELVALLDHLETEFRVDPKRIYVTGLSMGGFGTWELAATIPDRLAAVLPICGGGEPFWAGTMKPVPVWAFHGERDPVVPLRRSEEMVDALSAVGGQAKLTVYPDVGHDSWTPTYAEDSWLTWLQSHVLGEPSN